MDLVWNSSERVQDLVNREIIWTTDDDGLRMESSGKCRSHPAPDVVRPSKPESGPLELFPEAFLICFATRCFDSLESSRNDLTTGGWFKNDPGSSGVVQKRSPCLGRFKNGLERLETQTCHQTVQKRFKNASVVQKRFKTVRNG